MAVAEGVAGAVARVVAQAVAEVVACAVTGIVARTIMRIVTVRAASAVAGAVITPAGVVVSED